VVDTGEDMQRSSAREDFAKANLAVQRLLRDAKDSVTRSPNAKDSVTLANEIWSSRMRDEVSEIEHYSGEEATKRD